MTKFIFATHNANKVKEVSEILDGLNIEIKSLSDIDIHKEIVEDGNTLNQNAWIKADFIKDLIGGNVIAEDTGLEVDSLKGDPGVYSARYAGSQRSSQDNMSKLLDELENHSDRSAQFRTVLAVWFEGWQYTFEGIVRGHIAEERTGKGGFGYDPIFIPDGYESSFGVLSSDIKNEISHRGRAFLTFKDFMMQYMLN